MYVQEIKCLIFGIVLVVFHQYTPAIDNMSCTIDIHRYIVDIPIIGRLEVMDDERKTYGLLSYSIRQFRIVVEIEFQSTFQAWE